MLLQQFSVPVNVHATLLGLVLSQRVNNLHDICHAPPCVSKASTGEVECPVTVLCHGLHDNAHYHHCMSILHGLRCSTRI